MLHRSSTDTGQRRPPLLEADRVPPPHHRGINASDYFIYTYDFATLPRRRPVSASREFVVTSPGCAWRPIFDFSKIGTPSRVTSNLPPRDGTSFTSSPGNAERISAAKLT